MTLWYDLSTSLGSTGMSGTVRTELEVCRALQKKTKDLKFFRFTDGKIKTIGPVEAPWLYDLSKPIGDAYLKVVSERPRAAPPPPRDEHLDQLTRFARHVAPHPLDRTRNSVLFALSVLPPPVVEAVLDTLGPHANATLQLAHRLNAAMQPRHQPPPPPPPSTTPPHPFSKGDAIFTVGIDWGLDFLPLLKRIREKTPITVHQVVHDLTPIVVPQFHVERNCELYREFIFNVGNVVDTAWYISEQTRLDAEQVFKSWRLPIVPSKQVRWGSVPPPPDTRTEKERKALLAHRGITRPFMLFVSTVEARKNHETVYRAYRQLLKERGPTIPQLVFVGHGGWKRSEFLGWLHRDPVVKGHLKHFSANDAELDALYRECLFTVYPSLYEGWGLPIVESQAYGKPVLISDAPSLREAAGPKAEAVEALSVSAWAAALGRYLFEPGVLERVTKAQREAFEPVAWSHTADQILAGVKS
ncbi:MAG: glycosyltransferase family 1 protein [Myxococcaceae bacterium]